VVVMNTMYYVTHTTVEDVFVSLTHMSMNIMFLENVVWEFGKQHHYRFDPYKLVCFSFNYSMEK
jgi:hypothetical protein